MIPFLDLPAQHLALEEELVQIFRDALKKAAFIGGHQVEAFEEEFARFCDTKYCVGVNSGTDALRFALTAAGVTTGDIVVTVPNTFIATTEAISQAGALPVFVDIDARTCNMDPAKLAEYLSHCDAQTLGRIKAVIPVHLYGQPVDMDSILALAEKYGFLVIEDACQAHGARYFSKKHNRWKKAGSLGVAAAFSFYPGKNLGACGEGGAITTNDEGIAKTARMLRDHGQAKKYYHDLEGYNGRLDAIQAGILRVKLRHLPDWTDRRRKNAKHYNQLLNGVDGVTIPHEPSWAEAVYHLYVIQTARREGLQKYLADGHIATGLHYPLPLHLQKAYARSGYKEGDFPVSERAAKEILSLPMFPELTSDQIEEICDTIKQFFSS
jgi:dTDP-4-amino-4,6-dideoxygalactose transaminase